MKWFFLVSFIAAIICSVFWTTVIVFAIVTRPAYIHGRQLVALIAPLLFFIYGARETLKYYKEARGGSDVSQ